MNANVLVAGLSLHQRLAPTATSSPRFIFTMFGAIILALALGYVLVHAINRKIYDPQAPPPSVLELQARERRQVERFLRYMPYFFSFLAANALVLLGSWPPHPHFWALPGRPIAHLIWGHPEYGTSQFTRAYLFMVTFSFAAWFVLTLTAISAVRLFSRRGSPPGQEPPGA